MQSRIALVAALIERLTKQMEDECKDVPSVVIDAPGQGIDDWGGYGDPLADTRPDFVKEAHADLRGMVSFGGQDSA